MKYLILLLSSAVSFGQQTPTFTPASRDASNVSSFAAQWRTATASQAALVSGTNIKTINGSSILGSGNISVASDLTSGPVTSSGGVSAIADAALSMAKTSGLNTVLIDKQPQIFLGPVLPRTRVRLQSFGAAGTQPPFRLKQLSLGDSYEVNLSELMDTRVAKIREKGFGISNTVVGAVTLNSAAFSRTPICGTTWVLSGSGQSVQFADTTDNECYRVKAYCNVENGAGAFIVQTNTANAGWVAINQTETVAAVGTITGSGNLAVTITGVGISGSPLTLNVPVSSGDTNLVWAQKVRAFLNTNGLSGVYLTGGTGPAITLSKITAAATDATLQIQIAAGTATCASLPLTSVDVSDGSGVVSANNGGALGAKVVAYDFPTTEPRKVRAVWASGTVNILGFVVSDIKEYDALSRGGSAYYNFCAGGQSVNDWAQCPQTIWDTILQDIQPDFVTLKGDDGSWNLTCNATSAGVYGKMQAAYPMDWIFIGRHPSNASAYDGQAEGANTNGGNELLAMDREMRDFAIAQQQLWINPRKIHPTHEAMVAQGLKTNFDAHLNNRGQAWESSNIWQILAKVIGPAAQMYPNAGAGLTHNASYNANQITAVLPSGPAIGFSINGRTNNNTGSSWREMMSVSKLGDDGQVGIHVGRYNELRMATDPNGRWFISHGTQGFGNGLAAFPRYASAAVEIHGGNRTTVPALSLSGASGHTGDMLRVYKSSATTTGTEGTRMAGVTVEGVADFKELRIVTSVTPASATATGTAGTIHWDGTHIYVCIATDTWRRINLGAGGW